MATTLLRIFDAIASRGKRALAVSGGLTLALALLAAMAFQDSPASASSQMISGLGVLEACAVADDFDTGNDSQSLWRQSANAMTAAWPDARQVTNPQQPADPEKSIYVWASFMIVGAETDGDSTYAGYIPGAATGTSGTLTHTTFTYGDTDFRINGLFHRETNGVAHRLVFEVDKTLPQHLKLNVGNLEVLVREATVGGPNRNIYTWRLDAAPGWKENRRLVAVLAEELAPQRAAAPVCE